MVHSKEFSGGPVVRMLLLLGPGFNPLVRELESCKPCRMAKINK